jgi:plastocyanin
MLQKLTIFNGVLLVVSAIFLGVNVEVSTSEATNESDSLTENKTMSSNKTFNNTSAASGNNTIILNVAEIGDEEQYRWVDSSGAENPTLGITANKDYTIKISNPTDEEHQLIIDSKADGKTSEIAKSKEIKPDSKNVELKFKTGQVGELGYHCKYHPEMMNGTINVTQ